MYESTDNGAFLRTVLLFFGKTLDENTGARRSGWNGVRRETFLLDFRIYLCYNKKNKSLSRVL